MPLRLLLVLPIAASDNRHWRLLPVTPTLASLSCSLLPSPYQPGKILAHGTYHRNVHACAEIKRLDLMAPVVAVAEGLSIFCHLDDHLPLGRAEDSCRDS